MVVYTCDVIEYLTPIVPRIIGQLYNALSQIGTMGIVIASRHELCMLQCVAICRALFVFPHKHNPQRYQMNYILSKKRIKGKKYKSNINQKKVDKLYRFTLDYIDIMLKPELDFKNKKSKEKKK